jgi:hypothetical protein
LNENTGKSGPKVDAERGPKQRHNITTFEDQWAQLQSADPSGLRKPVSGLSHILEQALVLGSCNLALGHDVRNVVAAYEALRHVPGDWYFLFTLADGSGRRGGAPIHMIDWHSIDSDNDQITVIRDDGSRHLAVYSSLAVRTKTSEVHKL